MAGPDPTTVRGLRVPWHKLVDVEVAVAVAVADLPVALAVGVAVVDPRRTSAVAVELRDLQIINWSVV